MKCSVSPVFAFLILTNDWSIRQIQWMYCLVSPLWASFPVRTPCCWPSVLGVLLIYSSFRTSSAHWVFFFSLSMCPCPQASALHYSAVCDRLLVVLCVSERLLNCAGAALNTFLPKPPLPPAPRDDCMVAKIWALESDTSGFELWFWHFLMSDFGQVIEFLSLNVLLLKMGIKIVPISGGSFEAGPTASVQCLAQNESVVSISCYFWS